jgi:hypothetical protein
MNDDGLWKRVDGKYQEGLDGDWQAEYSEDPETGLWSATVFRHDVTEWQSHGFAALDDARRAAREFYDRV